MSRRRYLITYDIADDRRRTRIFQTLKDEGDHAQYSVFFCECDRTELARLRSRLRPHVHARDDQVLILDLGSGGDPLAVAIETMGRAYEPPSRVLVI